MAKKISEIIKSKKYTFIILSLIIFASGCVFGVCLTAFFRVQFFDPGRMRPGPREVFIDKTSALAGTPEKRKELESFLSDYFDTMREKRFKQIHKETLADIDRLIPEVEQYLSESKRQLFQDYLKDYKKFLDNFRRNMPPPPPR